MAKANCRATVGCLVKCGEAIAVVYEKQGGQGAWDIPAGGIEPGETPEQAIRRELYEEVGLQETDGVRLAAVYWVAAAAIPTVHFLYELDVTAAQPTFAPHTDDIEKVALFSHGELQELIDTGAYEHDLAKARFEFALTGGQPGGPEPADYLRIL